MSYMYMYIVGMIIIVIYGWDYTCEMTEDWIHQMEWISYHWNQMNRFIMYWLMMGPTDTLHKVLMYMYMYYPRL
uniref:Uncharacterized protein n=1 Tax=Amphimedon queenslandica TaxID=400682 RepID=A0A1X7TPW4_AMPQE